MRRGPLRRCISFLICTLTFSSISGNLRSISQPVSQEVGWRISKEGSEFFLFMHDSLLGKDILVFSRVNKAIGKLPRLILNSGAYRGVKTVENIVRVVRDQDNRYIVSMADYPISPIDEGLLSRATNEAIFPGGISALGGVHIGKNGMNKICITKLLLSENNILYFENDRRIVWGLNKLNLSGFSINYINSCSQTINIESERGYGDSVQIVLSTTLMFLPDSPMRWRCADIRVPFFTVRVPSFCGSDTIGYEKVITRWRLEPRPEDLEKYLAGELVEPKKPIIFFIDSSQTPKEWIPFLIQGVNDWQRSFELSGFKNAIQARVFSNHVTDSGVNIMDGSYSVIHILESDSEDGNYSIVIDPRTGEILQSHILISKNVVQRYLRAYAIQAAMSDISSIKTGFDEGLRQRIVRFICAHEVGHCLGFPHNFNGSSSISIRKLRDKKWVDVNGTTSSIMDYTSFNYVAQPEDCVGREGLFRHVGSYDGWGIKWGYSYFDLASSEERMVLDRSVKARIDGGGFCNGAPGENDNGDPRRQYEDLGNNQVLASRLGIRNLRVLNGYIAKAVEEKSMLLSDAEKLRERVIFQFGELLYYVSNINSVYSNVSANSRSQTILRHVPNAKKSRAIRFHGRYIFNTPRWLFENNTRFEYSIDDTLAVKEIQSAILMIYLDANTLEFLNQGDKTKNRYSVSKVLRKLRKYVWSDLGRNEEQDYFRQKLQLYYIARLKTLMSNENVKNSKYVLELLKRHSLRIREEVKRVVHKEKNFSIKQHLMEILSAIE